jgi:hypothetical protein
MKLLHVVKYGSALIASQRLLAAKINCNEPCPLISLFNNEWNLLELICSKKNEILDIS